MMPYIITFLWGMVAGYSLIYLVVRKQVMKIQREIDAVRRERQRVLEFLLKLKKEIEGAAQK